jgi:hypothetical protein
MLGHNAATKFALAPSRSKSARMADVGMAEMNVQQSTATMKIHSEIRFTAASFS